MKEYDATEQAYKNGYKKGYADGKADCVVRCKDCKHCAERPYRELYYCKILSCVFKQDHFCAYGERREGE